jgi:hypothetical protein
MAAHYFHTGPMDQTALAQRGRERLLDSTDEPGGAIADHQHR